MRDLAWEELQADEQMRRLPREVFLRICQAYPKADAFETAKALVTHLQMSTEALRDPGLKFKRWMSNAEMETLGQNFSKNSAPADRDLQHLLSAAYVGG